MGCVGYSKVILKKTQKYCQKDNHVSSNFLLSIANKNFCLLGIKIIEGFKFKGKVAKNDN